MKLILNNSFRVLKRTVLEGYRGGVPFLAAALSYYTVFSIVPLFIFLVSLGGFILGEELIRTNMLSFFDAHIGEETSILLESILFDISQFGSSPVFLLIAFLVVLYGATNLFDFISDALDRVFEIKLPEGNAFKKIVKKRTSSIIFLLVLAVFFVFIISLNTTLSIFREQIGILGSEFISDLNWQILTSIVSLLATMLVFSFTYRILSSATYPWRAILPGAALAAFLFTLVSFGVSFLISYIRTIGIFYGTAGALVITIMWVYYSSQVFLFGGKFIKVYKEEFFSEK